MNKKEKSRLMKKDEIEIIGILISNLTESNKELSRGFVVQSEQFRVMADTINKLADSHLLFMGAFNRVFMPKDSYKDLVHVSTEHDYIG